MSFIINSKYTETPINIDEIMQYNRDGFEKTHLTLTVEATDEKGAKSEINESIPLFDIKNLVQNRDNDFTWQFQNYSKVDIQLQVEILNEKREVLNRGTKFKENFINNYKNMIDSVLFKEYKENELYYRIRILCLDEGWEEYYPDQRGVLFQLNKDYNELKQTTINGDIRYIHDWLMDNIPNGENLKIDPNYLKRLIDLLCNPVDSVPLEVNPDNRGLYNVESMFTNYGEENNFGIHGKKMQFSIEDLDHFIADKHHLNTYINGKKVFHRDYKDQMKLDGNTKSYLSEEMIPQKSTVELETFKSHLMESEKFMVRYLLQTEQDVENIYSKGIKINSNNLGSYHTKEDFSILVRFKNSNSWKRINPFRTNIRVNFENNDRYSLTITVKDNYVPKIGNEIMVVSNNVIEAMFYKTDAFNQLANFYQVPCYFVPVSHKTDNGEVITEFLDEIKNVEVYVNGYRLTPDVDFTLINTVLHKQIPSIILFKDMTHFGSKIEVVFHDHRDNTYFFYKELQSREDNRAVITLRENDPPFINGTFTLFANNKKLHKNQYEIINSRSIILKNVETKKNVMLKFHHNEDDLLIRFLNLYKNNPSDEDVQGKRIGQDEYVNRYIRDNDTQEIFETDEDYYIGLKYVYQLNDFYRYFDQMYDMIKDNIAPELDANNNNLFTNLKEDPAVMDYMQKLPLYFNHDISINCNRPYNVKRFEDNVALFNPGRSYLIYKYLGEKIEDSLDIDFDCNKMDSVEFLTYLNENIPLTLPYLNNNILIDCNESMDRNNYKD